MALKPTIVKFDINLSDLDRNYFDHLELTVAQHPSEKTERMMVRVLAYCLNAQEALVFTKGLSTPDEPDIEAISLDGQRLLWLDVGEPKVERIKKATPQAKATKIYTFNSKTDVWWQQSKVDFAALNVEVYQFSWAEVQALALHSKRTVTASITVSEQSLFIAMESSSVELNVTKLQ